MSLPTNTFTAYVGIGNREDLSDEIYRIDPTDTPFISGVDREKASAVSHEWQTQALAAVDTANAQLEGDDAVTVAATATVRLKNYCQISSKVGRVSGTQQAVEHAGRDDELEYQEMLKGMELKRDMEAIVLTNQPSNVGAAATARQLGSIDAWIATNDDFNTSDGTSPTASGTDGGDARGDGTQRAFTEAQLKNVFQLCWTAGGKPNVVMTGGFNKQVMSTFTGRATPTEDAKSKKIVAAVDAYESDFGTVRVVANRFQRTRDVHVLEMDKWAIAYLRKFVKIPLARTGDSERFQMLSEYTLVARNEKASGGVYDLTTT
jgi:hypothetical protein